MGNDFDFHINLQMFFLFVKTCVLHAVSQDFIYESTLGLCATSFFFRKKKQKLEAFPVKVTDPLWEKTWCHSAVLKSFAFDTS